MQKERLVWYSYSKNALSFLLQHMTLKVTHRELKKCGCEFITGNVSFTPVLGAIHHEASQAVGIDFC
jgi:hypothetical protein